MDSLSPKEIVARLGETGAYKSSLPAIDILIRGFLSGIFLAYATVLAMQVALESNQGWLGALTFPVGFAMIILLGLELVTGNFATVPMAFWSKRTTGYGKLARNWALAFSGNLAGSLLFAVLWSAVVTSMGHHNDQALVEKVIAVASRKTVYYRDMGADGLLLVSIKAVLCNWMVTLGVVMGLSSTSTIGRIVALWMPIFIFFAMGLEHCVVNMFVIPAGILLGGPISLTDWWLWNQIPATIGNIVGGGFFTGFLLWFTYARKESSGKERGVEK